jgi:hypothetical protein
MAAVTSRQLHGTVKPRRRHADLRKHSISKPRRTPQNRRSADVSNPAANPAEPRRTSAVTVSYPAETRSLAGIQTITETMPDLRVCGVAGFCGVSQVISLSGTRACLPYGRSRSPPGAMPQPCQPSSTRPRPTAAKQLHRGRQPSMETQLGTENETPIIHTTAEAAVILRVTESWLKRRAAARRVPFTMLGGSYRFTTHHLAEIARMNEMTPRKRNDDIPSRQAARHSRGSQHTSSQTVTLLRPRPRTGPRQRAA